MSPRTELEGREYPQRRWGHNDASWLLNRTGIFGWPGDERRWLTLLSLLEGDGWIECGSSQIRVDDVSLDGTAELRSMLAAAAGAGWIECWHMYGQEDLSVGLTAAGRRELTRLLQAYLDDLHDRVEQVETQDNGEVGYRRGVGE